MKDGTLKLKNSVGANLEEEELMCANCFLFSDDVKHRYSILTIQYLREKGDCFQKEKKQKTNETVKTMKKMEKKFKESIYISLNECFL